MWYERWFLLKTIYLVAIIKHFESLPLKCIIPYEWLLIGSRDKCCVAVAHGDKYFYLHEWRIRCEKSIPAPCTGCGVGTKTKSYLCTRCDLGYWKKRRLEARIRINYGKVMNELVEKTSEI